MNVSYQTKEQAGLPNSKRQALIETELGKLRDKHGEVTPAIIVAAAKRPSHPLHEMFEWDDTVAAERWRLNQAHHLLMASKFVATIKESRGTPPKVVESHHIVRNLISSFPGEGFKARDVVLSKKDQRAAVVEQKREQLRSWCRSVVDLHEFHKLRVAILKEIGE